MEDVMQRIRGLAGSATDSPRIGLDACCLRYYINDPPIQPWADCLDPIFQAGVSGQAQLYVSTVAVAELLSQLHYIARDEAGYDPELRLMGILGRHFEILDVDRDVARAAGRLRRSYTPSGKMALDTPDALIGATSLARGHTLLVTNDARLADALPDGNCLYLRDVALAWLAAAFPKPCLSAGDPVEVGRRGPGLPHHAGDACVELRSIRPDPAAKWDRVLRDAFPVAAAVNDPCLFFVLTMTNGRRTTISEVLFWHEAMSDTREPRRVVKRLKGHIGYSPRRDLVANPRNGIHVFCFSSIRQERARQCSPAFASKSQHRRESDAWNAYLAPFRRFVDLLGVPQTSWLLCEDGEARMLDAPATAGFLKQAGSVLGWGAAP